MDDAGSNGLKNWHTMLKYQKTEWLKKDYLGKQFYNL